MKLLRRNVKKFEYLPYTGRETDLNDNGLHTGIFKPVYGNAVSYKGNISLPSGAVAQTFYGLEIRYSHILLMDDPMVDIQETGKIRYNNREYAITAVRRSMNVFSAALLEDTANHGEPYESEIDGEDETGGT